jgi:glutathione S-transferase
VVTPNRVLFVAGEEFSIADITAMCSIDFGCVVDVRINDKQTALNDWYTRVSARPSAKA